LPRDYTKEYARDQKKRKKYRAGLRTERVKRGLTGKDGKAVGKGGKHISHSKFGGRGKVSVTSAKSNYKRQPKTK
jgi:hypothetical protein